MKFYTSKNPPQVDIEIRGARVAVLSPQISKKYAGTDILKPDSILEKEMTNIGSLPLLVVALGEGTKIPNSDGSSHIEPLNYKVGQYVYIAKDARAEGTHPAIPGDKDNIIHIFHEGWITGVAKNPEAIDNAILMIKEDIERSKDDPRPRPSTIPNPTPDVDLNNSEVFINPENNLKVVN